MYWKERRASVVFHSRLGLDVELEIGLAAYVRIGVEPVGAECDAEGDAHVGRQVLGHLAKETAEVVLLAESTFEAILLLRSREKKSAF